MSTWMEMFKETLGSWIDHNGKKMGAALAYYTAFSLAPLVVMIVGIMGWFVGREAVSEELMDQSSMLVGEAGTDTIELILSNAAMRKTGFSVTLMGSLLLLVGASAVFAELQDSLNAIWEVRSKRGRWRLLIRKRLLSFVTVFALGFLVLVSLLLSSGLAAMRAYAEERVPGWEIVWENANLLVSLVLVTIIFAAVFRCLPDVRIHWRDVWVGAALTGVLFTLGKFVLGLYLRHSAFASVYGAAGSFLVMLVWIFYSSQIFFLGAEFTRVYARRRGSHCRDAAHESAGSS